VGTLRRWAAAHGIDLANRTRKGDIVDALVAGTGSATVPEGD
jgi:hypothetical protein